MLLTNHAVPNRADLRERTKTMRSRGDRRGQIADFRDSFERIKWLYLHSKCGIKTKTHFEWLLWHWSSLGQLNLEPTWPNGLVGYTHTSFDFVPHLISPPISLVPSSLVPQHISPYTIIATMCCASWGSWPHAGLQAYPLKSQYRLGKKIIWPMITVLQGVHLGTNESRGPMRWGPME